jgi:hypothetical protein
MIKLTILPSTSAASRGEIAKGTIHITSRGAHSRVEEMGLRWPYSFSLTRVSLSRMRRTQSQ